MPIDEDLKLFSKIRDKVRFEIKSLKKVLGKRWSNSSNSRMSVNEFDGAFSSREAIRCTISGESNFLIKKTRKKDNKPAICLLVDLSGSMVDPIPGTIGGMTHAYAQTQAMVAISEALNTSKIPLRILGFSDACASIKDWNESLTSSRGKIGGSTKLYCSTNLELAVLEGIRSFSSRKEQKKVLIVISDGEVHDITKRKVKALMNLAHQNMGTDFEAYGLGIGVDLSSIFSQGGEVDISNLTTSIRDIVTKGGM